MSTSGPKAHLGHPDPNHPTNKYKGEDAFLFDDKGRPVTSKGRWGGKGTDLWIFLLVSEDQVDLHGPADGLKPPEVCTSRIGRVWFTVGVSEGRPTFKTKVHGQALELPSDLARDDLKKQYLIDWLKDTAVENLTAAVRDMNFSGLRSPEEFSQWLANSAEKTIKRMGL